VADGDASSPTDVVGSLAYLDATGDDACYRVYPPSSGRPAHTPAMRRVDMRIADCRPIAAELDLDREGFQLRDALDADRVKADYYPEMAAWLRQLVGAEAVVVFDHNVRSAAGAALGQVGVRAPVDAVHDDYTETSGARRAAELLDAHGLAHLKDRRVAMINVWRPLHGPVLDLPLTLCAAPSVAPRDLVATPIHHYAEGRLDWPSHSGDIYSARHNPAHRWYYVSAMQPGEVLVFKGYDSRKDVARYVPHTAFVHPDCPARFTPRESIEVRAVVVYRERA
jgi:hypothetical protein